MSNIESKYRRKLESICNISNALAKTKDINTFLEFVLQEAIAIINCDGGTIYHYDSHHKSLNFEITLSCSLGIHTGGTSDNPNKLKPIYLFDTDGNVNSTEVCAQAALTKKIINIKNAYEVENNKYHGLRKFDKQFNYRTQSILNAPFLDSENKLLGVLQLINKFDKDQNIIAFDHLDELIIQALSAQSSMAVMYIHLLNSKY